MEERSVGVISKVLEAAGKKILSIGSGDGFASLKIAREHPNIVVTFCEPNRHEVLQKYPSAAANLNELESRGIEMHFGILPNMLGQFIGPLGSTDDERKFDSILFFHMGVDINSVDLLKKNKGITLT